MGGRIALPSAAISSEETDVSRPRPKIVLATLFFAAGVTLLLLQLRAGVRSSSEENRGVRHVRDAQALEVARLRRPKSEDEARALVNELCSALQQAIAALPQRDRLSIPEAESLGAIACKSFGHLFVSSYDGYVQDARAWAIDPDAKRFLPLSREKYERYAGNFKRVPLAPSDARARLVCAPGKPPPSDGGARCYMTDSEGAYSPLRDKPEDQNAEVYALMVPAEVTDVTTAATPVIVYIEYWFARWPGGPGWRPWRAVVYDPENHPLFLPTPIL